MRWLIAIAFLFAASACTAQTIKHAFCGNDGKLHLVYEDGTASIQPKERLQVSCDSVAIADDKQTVGWSVLVENCCTSYPIATAAVVLSHGKKRVFRAHQMLVRWKFVEGSKRFAMLSGPVHGDAVQATLYDLRTGKQLETWCGVGELPQWASEWQSDFGLLENN